MHLFERRASQAKLIVDEGDASHLTTRSANILELLGAGGRSKDVSAAFLAHPLADLLPWHSAVTIPVGAIKAGELANGLVQQVKLKEVRWRRQCWESVTYILLSPFRLSDPLALVLGEDTHTATQRRFSLAEVAARLDLLVRPALLAHPQQVSIPAAAVSSFCNCMVVDVELRVTVAA